jgi:predicted nucleic acid-binding protein
MKKTFVETSALYALLSMDDINYQKALTTWERLVEDQTSMITNNYVLVECFSLLQRRLGINAAGDLDTKIAPLLLIDWIGAEEHANIVNLVMAANQRQLSLVDCSCFESMRRLGIENVFSFDKHFREQGFDIIP